MTLFDFFSAPELPVPQIDDAGAAALGGQLTGRAVRAEELGSQQDANFLLTDDAGIVGVLKIANAVFTDLDPDAQDAVTAHLAAALPDLRFATTIPAPAVTYCSPAGPSALLASWSTCPAAPCTAPAT